MKEMTYEEFCTLPLQYTFGLNGDDGAHRLYRNDEIGLQKEVHTLRKVKGDIYSGWKKPSVGFFLDGDERQFDTPDQVYVAYMEKVCNTKETA